MALVLIRAVADFAEPFEEYGAAECILLLTRVEADVAATTQLRILQPLQRKESPFQLCQFAQREGQTVLPGRRPRACAGSPAGFDRHCEAEHFEPLIGDDANIDAARHQRSELGSCPAIDRVAFLPVANTRDNAEAQQAAAHGKHMIRKAHGVRVVLINDKAALVIEQSVEDMGRLVSGRGDHLGVKGPN